MLLEAQVHWETIISCLVVSLDGQPAYMQPAKAAVQQKEELMPTMHENLNWFFP